MKKSGSLKEYFQGMEIFFDENLVTSFEVTEKAFPELIAQLEWLKRETDQWTARVSQNSYFKVECCSFEKNDERSELFFKATVVAFGGIKNSLSFTLNPTTKTGILNTIKKDLAKSILRDFPFFPSSGRRDAFDDLLKYPPIAKGVPVSFSCGEVMIENPLWQKIQENDFMKGGVIYELISKMLLSEKAEIMSIYSINYDPISFFIDVIFTEDVSSDHSKRIVAKFYDSIGDYQIDADFAPETLLFPKKK